MLNTSIMECPKKLGGVYTNSNEGLLIFAVSLLFAMDACYID
jgi:hypothetical protein